MHPRSIGTEAPELGTLRDFTLCTSSPNGSFVSFLMSFVINQYSTK